MIRFTRDEILRHAQSAQQILAAPVFNMVFENLDAYYHEAWAATGVHQSTEREQLWNQLIVLAKVKTALQELLSLGVAQVATAEAESPTQPQEPTPRTAV